MKISNEVDYFEQNNFEQGKELARVYMKEAKVQVPNVIGSGILPLEMKSEKEFVERFFHERYLKAVYIYRKNGGWYNDIVFERGDKVQTFGTSHDAPFRTRKEAVIDLIGTMALVIAFGKGKMKCVDMSQAAEEKIDFRIYDQMFVLPRSSVLVYAEMIEAEKINWSCTTKDIIIESISRIHEEMSKPAYMRDNSYIWDRMLALLGCDVYLVNPPADWEGDPFYSPV